MTLPSRTERDWPLRRRDVVRLLIASALIVVALGSALSVDVASSGLGLQVGTLGQRVRATEVVPGSATT